MISSVTQILIATLAITGAATVLWTRDVMRMALGLGVFLLAVAAQFASLSFGFLALAELFVYVGGVLVLMLFAIMLVHRATPGEPSLDTRHDPLSAVAALGLAGIMFASLRDVGGITVSARSSGIDAVGELLLGPMLPLFELSGLLLLVALVAVVSLGRGDRR